MDRDAAIALVQEIMNGGCSDEADDRVLLEKLDRAFGCPTGYVNGLIFWPRGPEPTAAEVVDQALAYRPFAL
ncbi:e9imm peptide [Streptomyces sp. NPDC020192]|uniref:e9imm peptide n=1 Tax=Streptomyces sp. NPDC020192 TaxID=3365066 RepID=UPI003793C857